MTTLTAPSTGDQSGIATPSARSTPGMGPFSRAIDRGSVGWSIDGRSREGRFLRTYELMLIDHVGGKPTRLQSELIRRCARLALHLELQDERAMSIGEMSDHASRQYLAWHEALAPTLQLLGMQGKRDRAPTIQELLAAQQKTA